MFFPSVIYGHAEQLLPHLDIPLSSLIGYGLGGFITLALIMNSLIFLCLLYATRTAGAAGPLVLESGGCFFFFFYHQFFFSNPTIFQFHHNFYHKYLPQVLPQMLPQTTTTYHYHNLGVNIYYHTNFCSNPTIFQFYHTFYYTCYHNFYHKPLPLSPQPPHNIFCT